MTYERANELADYLLERELMWEFFLYERGRA